MLDQALLTCEKTTVKLGGHFMFLVDNLLRY